MKNASRENGKIERKNSPPTTFCVLTAIEEKILS
jgi:hypothetical protein